MLSITWKRSLVAKKEKLPPILDLVQEEIEKVLDTSNRHVWGSQHLKQFLKTIDTLGPLLSTSYIPTDDVIKFLIKKSRLINLKFKTPRIETLYCWRNFNEYELMPVLRPKGYYTHLSALYFHELLDYEPNCIYFNHEQPARPPLVGNLEQSRIDNAFKKKQRLTTARTVFDGKEYWLLNGKQTGNYGAIKMKFPGSIVIPVTDLERTLIDITVRPAYARGVDSVLKAFRLAQPKVSIEKLIRTLRILNYVYPYHQSIGFYLEKAGNYSNEEIQQFSEYNTLKYDFYLDYEIKAPAYSEKWRVYYPKDLK
mgnify:CR=1 FL=1